MSHKEEPSHRAPLPKEIAPDVYCLEVGKGITRSNVYFVRSGSSWALIDTASAHCGDMIQEAAASLFGATTPPAAILLTHDHPDHAGSTRDLARRWGCWVYVHPDELPLVMMDSASYLPTVKRFANPLDTWVVLPLLHVLPRKQRESMLAASSFKDMARALAPGSPIPGLPDWESIATPGHSPGHVAFFRPSDRVLIAGDAVVTVDLNSWWRFLLWGLGRNQQRLAGPPRYTTWSWPAAKESIAVLARLEPRVLACGHGLPMVGSRTVPALRALADHGR
jgi:glyoxylase-like metal-dependent hydrolase (beta-lactamase superfamily II)